MGTTSNAISQISCSFFETLIAVDWLNRTPLSSLPARTFAYSPTPNLYLRHVALLTAYRCAELCVWMVISLPLSLTFADEASRAAAFRDQLQPLLKTYCFECHGTDHAEGDVSLEKYRTVEELSKDRKEWLRALKQVQLGTMPPEGSVEMDSGTRARMVKLIDELANAVDCVRNPNPGKVVMRRLNRQEYRNTVRDLTGVDYQPPLGPR